MIEGTDPREIQYSFTTLHDDTLWKTIFNEFLWLGMSIHVTDMYVTCMGERLSHHVTGYTEWRKNVMRWQFLIVL